MLKPKIEGIAEREEIRNVSGSFRRVICRTFWVVSCPCNTDRAIGIVPSWDAAVDMALLHGRALHAKP